MEYSHSRGQFAWGHWGGALSPRFTYCINGRQILHLPSKVIRDSRSLGPGDAVEVVIDTVAHHERPGEMHQDGTEVAGSVSHSLGFGHFEGGQRDTELSIHRGGI